MFNLTKIPPFSSISGAKKLYPSIHSSSKTHSILALKTLQKVNSYYSNPKIFKRFYSLTSFQIFLMHLPIIDNPRNQELMIKSVKDTLQNEKLKNDLKEYVKAEKYTEAREALKMMQKSAAKEQAQADLIKEYVKRGKYDEAIHILCDMQAGPKKEQACLALSEEWIKTDHFFDT